jgi:hypothetical protein
MTLQVQKCIEVITHALPGEPASPVEAMEMVNQAGHWLVSIHPWEWLKGRTVDLDLRAQLSFTGASWTAATRTINSTGSFASYSFLSGDSIEVTAGTGVVVGNYEIESRTDDDNIVLATSILATDIADASVGGTIDNDQVSLPSDFDFQRIEAYAASNGLVNTMNMTSRQRLLDLRAANPSVSTLSFWTVTSWVLDSTTSGGAAPVQRLEFWPPVTSDRRALRIWYTAGWRNATMDSDIVGVPNFMELFFLECVKAVAKGHEKEMEGDMASRLERLLVSPWLLQLKLRDGMSVRDRGEMQNGSMETGRVHISHFDNERTVLNP